MTRQWIRKAFSPPEPNETFFVERKLMKWVKSRLRIKNIK